VSGADGKVLGPGFCGTIVQTTLKASMPRGHQADSCSAKGNGRCGRRKEWGMEKHLITILTGGAWQGIGVPAAGLIKYWRRGGLRT
jgi:hypothetical protein